MRLRWTEDAAEDLQTIYTYLQQARPADLHSTVERLYRAAQSLRPMPFRGHTGVLPGTLEMIALPLPYIISYRVTGDVVQILGFRHTSQDPTVH